MDPGGILRVGPESAGAEPGAGVLRQGRRQADGGGLEPGARVPFGDEFPWGVGESLDSEKAEEAIDKDLSALGLSTVEAAYGVHQVVSTNMAEGIRLLAARRGVDPRDFSLVAVWGVGGGCTSAR